MWSGSQRFDVLGVRAWQFALPIMVIDILGDVSVRYRHIASAHPPLTLTRCAFCVDVLGNPIDNTAAKALIEGRNRKELHLGGECSTVGIVFQVSVMIWINQVACWCAHGEGRGRGTKGNNYTWVGHRRFDDVRAWAC